MERHICLREKYVLSKLMNYFFNKHLKPVSTSNEIKILQEKQKAEEALNELKRQYDAEVGDLQVTIKKLKKVSE